MRISDWSSDVCSSDLSFLPEDFGINPDDLTEDSRRELDAYKKRNAAYQASWEQDGFIGTPVEWLDENAATQFKTQQLAIAGGGESQTMNTKVACTKLLDRKSVV